MLFSCPIITTDLLSQLIFYREAVKMSVSLNRFGLSYLSSVMFLEVIICSFVKFRNFRVLSFECIVPLLCTTFCHWLIYIYNIYKSFAPLSWAENWCCKMFTSTQQVHTMSTHVGCVWMYSAEVPSQIHMTCAVILLHEYSVHLAYCESAVL